MKTLDEALKATVDTRHLQNRKQRRQHEAGVLRKYGSLADEVYGHDGIDDFAFEAAQLIIDEYGENTRAEPLCCLKHAMQEAFVRGMLNGVMVGMEMERQELPDPS